MRFVVFGLSVSSSWGNGHATVWRGLLRALAGRGHEVFFFEKDTPWYASHRDLERLEGAILVIYKSFEEVEGRAMALLNGSVGVVTSYCPDGAAASELVFSSGASARLFYDLDAPVTLERLEKGDRVEYIPEGGLSRFDIVLSFTGGSSVDGLKNRLGARRVETLYGCVDPLSHRAVKAVEMYASDLSYIGTYSPDRSGAFERLFTAPSRMLENRRFILAGAQYPEGFPGEGNIRHIRHLPPREHPAFYSSSRFTLNITRAAMAASGYCPSARLFEAAACGVPVLSDLWEGIDAFFEPGREIVIVDTPHDVAEALSMTEERRVSIASEALKRVLAEHTAEARAAELEGILDKHGLRPLTGC